MKVLGVDLPFDLLDVRENQKLERAMDVAKLETMRLKGQQFKSQSSALLAMCKPYEKMLDTVWGSGTSKKLFPNGSNFRKCMDAMEDIIAAKNRTNEEITDLQHEFEEKQKAFKTKHSESIPKELPEELPEPVEDNPVEEEQIDPLLNKIKAHPRCAGISDEFVKVIYDEIKGNPNLAIRNDEDLDQVLEIYALKIKYGMLNVGE